MKFPKPVSKDYLPYVVRGGAQVSLLIFLLSLIIAGVGFFILALYRGLGTALGYEWARLAMGFLCGILGILGGVIFLRQLKQETQK